MSKNPNNSKQSTENYQSPLWCDLTTDEDRLMFLELGRAEETGIIAPSVVPDIIELVKSRIKNRLAWEEQHLQEKIHGK